MLEESLGYFHPKSTELQSQVTHGDYNSKKGLCSYLKG